MRKKENSKKSEFLSVRVSKEVKDHLEDIAEENERSVSWVVSKILEKFTQGKSKKL